MSHHFIDDDELMLRIPVAEQDAIRAWLAGQPEVPRLVGTTAAAKILGIRPPHVTRLRDQGRMPEPIPVEGSVDVYIRSEVEALARTLRRERAKRAARREAK